MECLNHSGLKLVPGGGVGSGKMTAVPIAAYLLAFLNPYIKTERAIGRQNLKSIELGQENMQSGFSTNPRNRGGRADEQ